MYSFKNDYSEGAHPDILATLSQTNLEQQDGYGEDAFSLQAAELIKQRIGLAELDVHFLTGGTQTNLTAISAFLSRMKRQSRLTPAMCWSMRPVRLKRPATR